MKSTERKVISWAIMIFQVQFAGFAFAQVVDTVKIGALWSLSGRPGDIVMAYRTGIIIIPRKEPERF